MLNIHQLEHWVTYKGLFAVSTELLRAPSTKNLIFDTEELQWYRENLFVKQIPLQGTAPARSSSYATK